MWEGVLQLVKRIDILCLLLIIPIFFVFSFSHALVYGEISDGSYDLPFKIKKKDRDELSIVHSFFAQPASLLVEGEDHFVQVLIKNTEVIKDLQTENGPVEILQELEGEGIRLISFQVETSLLEPILLRVNAEGADQEDAHLVEMHVELEGLGLDLDEREEAEREENEEEENSQENNEEENSQEKEPVSSQKDTSRDGFIDKTSSQDEVKKKNISREPMSFLWIPVTLLFLIVIGLISYLIYRNNGWGWDKTTF